MMMMMKWPNGHLDDLRWWRRRCWAGYTNLAAKASTGHFISAPPWQVTTHTWITSSKNLVDNMQVDCQKRLSWVSGHHNHPRNSFITKSELDCSKRDFIRQRQGSWWAVKDTSEGNFWAGGLRPRLGNPRVWGGCHWCCLPQKQTHRLENCTF